MKNCFLCSISMSYQLSNSPISSQNLRLLVRKGTFSRFFSGFHRSFTDAEFLGCRFNDFLDHPLTFTSCSSRTKTDDSYLGIKDSQFCNCLSTSEPGGAVYAYNTGGTVNITNCHFYACSSTGSFTVSYISTVVKAGGGGCALLCNKFYVKTCCFAKCHSIERGPALFTASTGTDDAEFNHSAIYQATGGTCPIHFTQGKDIMSNINSTSNTCINNAGGGFTFSGSRNLIQFSIISNCVTTRIDPSVSARIFDFSLGSTSETCRLCNIVNNSNMNSLKVVLFSYRYELLINGFVFNQNDSPLCGTEVGSIYIENCVSDATNIGIAIKRDGNTLGVFPLYELSLNITNNSDMNNSITKPIGKSFSMIFIMSYQIALII